MGSIAASFCSVALGMESSATLSQSRRSLISARKEQPSERRSGSLSLLPPLWVLGRERLLGELPVVLATSSYLCHHHSRDE